MRRLRIGSLCITIVAIAILAFLPALAWAQATVTTDKLDYYPGEVAYITGAGFHPNETVWLQVTAIDGGPTWDWGTPWDVQTDQAGSFTSEWPVYEYARDRAFLLTADCMHPVDANDITAHIHAETTFTDGVGTNLDQLQNGTDTKDPEWSNGDINGQNSCYAEGDSIPFRYFLTGLDPEVRYTFSIQHQWTKGEIHAYDYLTTYDRTESGPIASAGGACGDISTSPPDDCGGAVSWVALPDPSLPASYMGTLPAGFSPPPPTGLPAEQLRLFFYNAENVTLTQYHFVASGGGDYDLQIEVTFDVIAAGSVGFYWGGHLAAGADYGVGQGSGSISGAPFHMRAIDVTPGAGAKNQDRSNQPGAICVPPDATITCDPGPYCEGSTHTCSAAAGAGSYEWIVTGATILSGQGTNQITYQVTAPGGGNVIVSLNACNAASGCPADPCCHSDSVTIPVVEVPSCSISGPDGPLCPNSTANSYTGPAGMDSYEWTISGNGSISGPADQQTVTVTAGSDCGEDFTLLLRVTDNGCESVCTKAVPVDDTEKPTITTCPTGSDLGCNPLEASLPTCESVKALVVATDNCHVKQLNCSREDSDNNCTHTRVFTITAQDDCGNLSDPCVVTYTWTADTTSPTITSCPTGGDLGCNPPPGSQPTSDSVKALVTANDNCHVKRLNCESQDSDSGCTHTRVFTIRAEDDCGNLSDPCVVTFTWTVDTTPPVITCPPDIVRTVLGDPCSAAVPFTVTATDDCAGPVTVVCRDQFGVIRHSGDTFEGGTYTITATATDECGNSSTCTFTITVRCVPMITISGFKYYDTNTNGGFDVGEPVIPNFRICVSWVLPDGTTGSDVAVTDVDGFWTSLVPLGATFTACECKPLPEGMIQTGPIGGRRNPDGDAVANANMCWTGVVDLSGVQSLNFFNVCATRPRNGYTIGYWSNKNGERVLLANDKVCREVTDVTYDTWRTRLSALCLRKYDGTNYDVPFPPLPTVPPYAPICSPSFNQAYFTGAAGMPGFRTWLNNANSTNMAYMLSAQLAATELNIWYKGLNEDAVLVLPYPLRRCIEVKSGLVGPFTIEQIVDLAEAELCTSGHGTTRTGSPYRSYQECLKNALDGINSNKWWFQSSEPCVPVNPPVP